MTLNGANVFFDTTDYTIYTMNSVNTGRYCVVLPKNNNGTYNMLVDLHMQNAFDSVSNGSKTKEQLVEEIKNEYMGVKTKYNDGILVLPMIDENLYANAVITNDKQKMFDKVKKIGAITSEIYKKLTDDGIDKQKIDQKIIIIIKNNDDINNITFGDIIRETKRKCDDNSSGYLCYVMFGDPALRLRYPNNTMMINEINDTSLDTEINLSAMSDVIAKGIVLNADGEKDDLFNGILHVKMYDSESNFKMLNKKFFFYFSF